MPLVFASGKRSRAAQRSFHFCCRPAVWSLSKTGAIPKNNSLSEDFFLWTSYRGRRIDHFVAILKRIFWLVVSNIFYFPFHIWDVILPIDELIFFKMVKTTNQFSWKKTWLSSGKKRCPVLILDPMNSSNAASPIVLAHRSHPVLQYNYTKAWEHEGVIMIYHVFFEQSFCFGVYP